MGGRQEAKISRGEGGGFVWVGGLKRQGFRGKVKIYSNTN